LAAELSAKNNEPWCAQEHACLPRPPLLSGAAVGVAGTRRLQTVIWVRGHVAGSELESCISCPKHERRACNVLLECELCIVCLGVGVLR
jgi:hypothetical protein